jgi:hypothetical protein
MLSFYTFTLKILTLAEAAKHGKFLWAKSSNVINCDKVCLSECFDLFGFR